MEAIFSEYVQHFQWLKIIPIRKHILAFCKATVSKKILLRRLGIEIAALNGDIPPDKVTKLVSSFAKCSLHSTDPERAAVELSWIKDSEKHRLRKAIEKHKTELESNTMIFNQSLDTALTAARVESRPMTFVPVDEIQTEKWTKLIEEIQASFAATFALNVHKRELAKQKKQTQLAARRAKDDAVIMVTRKELTKLVNDAVKKNQKSPGKEQGRRPGPRSPSGSHQKGKKHNSHRQHAGKPGPKSRKDGQDARRAKRPNRNVT